MGLNREPVDCILADLEKLRLLQFHFLFSAGLFCLLAGIAWLVDSQCRYLKRQLQSMIASYTPNMFEFCIVCSSTATSHSSFENINSFFNLWAWLFRWLIQISFSSCIALLHPVIVFWWHICYGNNSIIFLACGQSLPHQRTTQSEIRVISVDNNKNNARISSLRGQKWKENNGNGQRNEESLSILRNDFFAARCTRF